MLPKAILFDLDDTIISFDAGAEPAWIEVCNEFSANTKLIDSEKLYFAIVKVRDWFWSDEERHKIGRNNMIQARRIIVNKAFEELGLINKNQACTIADQYSKKRLDLLELFPQARETLEKLLKSKVRMALLTNGEAAIQRYKLERFDLEKYFEHILIEGELGYGKPDKRVYKNALDKLNLTVKDVWMIGDNLNWDIKSPQELGIFSIWVDFKKKGLPKESQVSPNRIVSNISELIDEESI